MATTGELRAIVQELHLVDIGDAAAYLGEETSVEEELPISDESALMLSVNTALTAVCESGSCQFAHS